MNDLSTSPRAPHALADSQPLLAAFSALLLDAKRQRATDIHLEPYAVAAPLRFRVDGSLRDIPPPANLPLEQLLPLVKSLCGLKPAEHQSPKEGHGSISFAGKRLDFTAATFPTLHGERLTLHLPSDSIDSLSLDHLRLAPAECVQLLQLTDLSHGVVVAAGPDGIGKTTMLYALLLHMDRTGRSIMTIEDPITSQIPGICQTAVDPAHGLTWHHALNHILRQDPDVLALSAPPRHRSFPSIFSAAQNHRLVFLQLTTGSGAHTIRHLLDSGLPAFQITDGLQAVVAQRLVRVLCPECKAESTPNLDTFAPELADFISGLPGSSFFAPVGCGRCRHTGYESILPMLEILTMNDALRDLIATNPSLTDLRAATAIEGLAPLLHNAILKASVGLVSLDEIRRVLPANSM